MTILNITNHCRNERMQQRGIPQSMIDLVTLYGECHRRPGHPVSLYLSKKSLKKMREAGVEKQVIIEAEKRPNMRFIVDEVTGTLITIIHADKNKQRVH
jgi:hypothetical protein